MTARVAVAKGGIYLAASPGGHLDLLEAIDARLELPAPTWVTVAGPRARRLSERCPGRVIALPWFERRSPLASLRNVTSSIGAAIRGRPRLVICSGAGGVLVFALAARLLGARLIFVETMARVADASATARLLGRFAEQVIVQWPEGARFHSDPVVCRPLLLEQVGQEAAPTVERSGCAAFVGTHSEPFERLVGVVEAAAQAGILPRPVRLQAGVCERASSSHVEVDAWLTGEEVGRRMATAEVVVAHGGAGMISTALRCGRRPIVVCRRRDLGEHVDDHQLQLARKLEAIGLAIVVEDAIDAADVELARATPTPPASFDGLPAVDDVVGHLIGDGEGRQEAVSCS